MRFNLVGSLTVLLAGCSSLSTGNPTGDPGSGGPTASVAIQESDYAPSVVTIQVGTRVIWTNAGTSTHSVTSDSGGFDSGALAPPKPTMNGDLYQLTFTKQGSYTYHCIFHTGMRGTITVQ